MPHPDHEKNRAAWNQIVDLHIKHMEYRTSEVIGGGSSLKPIELKALGDVKGKSLLHLMCQFGLDSLSWARLGADVIGVDISDQSIRRANEIMARTDLKAGFVRCDVLDLVGEIDRQFDIVFQSYGTHVWVSDIRRWAQVVSHYLKPGGTFFMVDGHPIEVLYLNSPLTYFSTEPERDTEARDYCDRSFHIKGEMIEWQHPVSEIVNALIDAGLRIDRMGEYDYGYYQVEEDWYRRDGHYWYPPGGPTPYPLMLSIKAMKT